MKGILIPEGQDGKIILNKELFEKEPVLAAAVKFTDQYYVGIQPHGENSFEVSICAKEGNVGNANILKTFCNELIEQQVRHDLQKRFGILREMIVTQAFYPIEKQ